MKLGQRVTGIVLLIYCFVFFCCYMQYTISRCRIRSGQLR